MKRTTILKITALCVFLLIFCGISAQESETGQSTVSNVPSPSQYRPVSPVVQEKPDALKLYREGRDLDSAGKTVEARSKYQRSVDVCRQELKENSKNIESYVVLGWSLIRLAKYDEVISTSMEALKINPREYRIIESLAEGYFYIDNYTEALKYFEQYLHAFPNGDRTSTAYFFVGDIFRLTARYEHADIAYSMALLKSPNMALWWYRLGSVRELSGKKVEAKAAYEKALKFKPIYQEASDALKRLS